jgi:putative Mg2+ transporter-C (MgtC) family protein
MQWDSVLSSIHIPINLGLAVLGGSVVGWNRQKTNHPAGLRTMMLVSLGSAAFALTGAAVLLKDVEGRNSADPTRVIAGIVGGSASWARAPSSGPGGRSRASRPPRRSG